MALFKLLLRYQQASFYPYLWGEPADCPMRSIASCLKSPVLRSISALLLVMLILLLTSQAISAQVPDFTQGLTMPKFDVQFEKAKNPVHQTYQLLMYMTIITLIPYFVVCCTSFIRVSVIFSFLKTSLGSSHAPSSQVWAALAMIVTIFIMAPVGIRIEKEAMAPYKAKKISYEQFVIKAQEPIIQFMKVNTRSKDLKLFILCSKEKNQKELFEHPPLHLMIPSFIISEMKTAFYIGFIMYLPFLCIDMITAAVLMSMGMFMMSPMSISMPIKLLAFVMIDGWEMLIAGLIKSYRYY